MRTHHFNGSVAMFAAKFQIIQRFVVAGLVGTLLIGAGKTSFGALQGYFPLNETNSPSLGTSVADASGLGHDGVMAADGTAAVGAVEGIASVNAALYGTAFSFSSAPTALDYVDIGATNTTFNFLTRDGALSYAAWIKPDATQFSPKPTFIGTNGSAFDFRIVSAGADWNLQLQSGNTVASGLTSTLSIIPSNVWTHVAVTKDINGSAGTNLANVNFYVDGKLVESGTVPRAGSGSTTKRLFLATGALTDQYYNGGIDEFHVYNEVLDADSIARLSLRHTGDFDLDGDVDGDDFSVWQNNFPTTSGATLTQGDADDDGDVDGADFVVWQTNFSFTPAPGTSTVPEPNTFVLVVLAGASVVVFRRRLSIGSRSGSLSCAAGGND
jgi:hypothetical protein